MADLGFCVVATYIGRFINFLATIVMPLTDLIFFFFNVIFVVVGDFSFNQFNLISTVAPQHPPGGQFPVTPSAVH